MNGLLHVSVVQITHTGTTTGTGMDGQTGKTKSPLDTEPLVIGQDLLDPLIDYRHGHIWAQGDHPKPLGPTGCRPAPDRQVTDVQESSRPLTMLMPCPEPVPDSAPSTSCASLQPPQADNPSSFHNHGSFLCSLENRDSELYSSRVVGGVQLNGTATPNVLLALWLEKSAVSQDLYHHLCQRNLQPSHSHRILSAESP